MACKRDHHEEPKGKSKHCKNEVNELLGAPIDVGKVAGVKNGTTIYGALGYQMVSKRATDNASTGGYPMRLATGTRPRGSNRVSLNLGTNFSTGIATRAMGVCEQTIISTSRKMTHSNCPLNAADSVML